mmetsp:Transcript_1171/g.1630  ORF Transcript_1171/g.1630 Transcript_1171/m.1630 type:complete len:331 (-) Transcript_1171:708-1700(-)
MKIFFATMLTMMVAMATSCDDSKDLLMVTYEKGQSFEGNDYKVEVTNNGNLQIIKKSDSSVIYDNGCYCKAEDGNCPGNFEVKLQKDANLFVNPQGGQNVDKVWKNHQPGDEGTYALVVNGNEPQILEYSGTRDCPHYGKKMWCPPKGGVCYGNEFPPDVTMPPTTTTDPPTTVPPCYTGDLVILMTTFDRGDEFHTGNSHLYIEDSGKVVLKWNDMTMFESDCECENRRQLRELTPSFTCNYKYEAKLQEDGHFIILPEGELNVKKIFNSQKTGPIGHYALVDNYDLMTGECLQVWRFNGDKDCPVFYEKLWDCSDCAWCKNNNNFCYT